MNLLAHTLASTLVVFLAQATALGQNPPSTPPPAPAATPNVYESVRRAEEDARRHANLKGARDARFGRVDLARQQQAIRLQIEALYREPNSEEKKLLRPSQQLGSDFRAFLKRGKTGIIKLIPDMGCADNSVIVVASEHCLKYSMPGGGSSYSFRTKNHRIARLSDLTFSGGAFKALGSMVRGILVDVGDVPINEVSAQTRGMRFLREYKLTPDLIEAIKEDRAFAAGKSYDGFVYSRSVEAKMGTTYLLRSAAYNGTLYKAVEGFAYNELAFDDRRDVIIAFRIVGEERDGITIIYHEIDSKRSPSFRWPDKVDTVQDNKFTAARIFEK